MPAGTLPTFLIAGAAKCGTTSLAGWLRAHPDVFVPAQKEIGFFEHDWMWEQGAEWYAQHFADAGDARAVGEGTPSYMFYPWSVERIAQTLPDVRVVICLRNPTDRAYSHYLHWRDRLMLEPRSFADAVEDELAAGADEIAPHRARSKPPYFAYLARGRFTGQLERLAGTFGRDRLHVVLLDDLHAEPEASFAAVCRFIGVDDTVKPPSLGSRENVYERHRNASLRRALIRRRILQRMPKPGAQWLEDHVFTPRQVSAPVLDPALRARLVDFYAPETGALGRWLGRDLSHWNR